MEQQYATGDAASSYLTPAPDQHSDILFSFEGRINRAKYWGYSLLIGLGVAVVAAVGASLAGQTGLWTAYLIALLLAIWPGLALGIKRCHDRNKSGWFMILSLIPILNIWYLIEIGFLKGTDGPNDYGEDPLG